MNMDNRLKLMVLREQRSEVSRTLAQLESKARYEKTTYKVVSTDVAEGIDTAKTALAEINAEIAKLR
jgi:hypothetical protein